jgi:hypothetical protein
MRGNWSTLISAILLAAILILLRAAGAGAATKSLDDDEKLFQAIRIGAPLSSLSPLGFDVAKAERLPKASLIKQYMPKNTAAFNSLQPAVQRCYRGTQSCTALIFDTFTGRVIFLIQDGQVTWKEMIYPHVV